MTKVERYEQALTELERHLENTGWSYDYVKKVVSETLRPAPVMEEVEEIVGWVNVYQRANGSCFAGSICRSEESANKQCVPNGCTLLSCQPIKVTVQREKPRPVERSVTVDAFINHLGDVFVPDNRDNWEDYVFQDHPSIFDMKVKLTATWTEETTT